MSRGLQDDMIACVTPCCASFQRRGSNSGVFEELHVTVCLATCIYTCIGFWGLVGRFECSRDETAARPG